MSSLSLWASPIRPERRWGEKKRTPHASLPTVILLTCAIPLHPSPPQQPRDPLSWPKHRPASTRDQLACKMMCIEGPSVSVATRIEKARGGECVGYFLKDSDGQTARSTLEAQLAYQPRVTLHLGVKEKLRCLVGNRTPSFVACRQNCLSGNGMSSRCSPCPSFQPARGEATVRDNTCTCMAP